MLLSINTAQFLLHDFSDSIHCQVSLGGKEQIRKTNTTISDRPISWLYLKAMSGGRSIKSSNEFEGLGSYRKESYSADPNDFRITYCHYHQSIEQQVSASTTASEIKWTLKASQSNMEWVQTRNPHEKNILNITNMCKQKCICTYAQIYW